MNTVQNFDRAELTALCETAQQLVSRGELEKCLLLAANAMAAHPDAPEPHNLMGIALERKGDRAGAMKHYRAAWALDPSYAPARENLERFGSISGREEPFWQAQDCRKEEQPREEYWDWNPGRFFRKILSA